MSVEKPILGHRKLQLKRLLAAGEHSTKQLAEMFDSAEGTIIQFKYRHRAEIDAIAADLSNEFAGLWIADKKNRIQVYEDQVELLHGSEDPKAVARTQTALRSVAEELGALPNRTTVSLDTPKVRVELVGVDAEDV